MHLLRLVPKANSTDMTLIYSTNCSNENFHRLQLSHGYDNLHAIQHIWSFTCMHIMNSTGREQLSTNFEFNQQTSQGCHSFRSTGHLFSTKSKRFLFNVQKEVLQASVHDVSFLKVHQIVNHASLFEDK